MKPLPNGENITIPRGKVYLRPEKSDGSLERGYIFFGDVTDFTTSGSTENFQAYSNTGPVREKIADVTTQIDRSISMTAQNVVMDNLAYFLMGDSRTVSQSSATGTSETITGVKTQRHYKLGESTSNPYGVQSISGVSVNNDTTSTSMTEGTDYELDASDGSIYVIDGGGISDGDDITVTYDQPQVDVPVIDTNDRSPITCDIYVSADNAVGTNRDVRIPRVEITPDGDLPWIQANENQTLSLSGRVSKRTGYEQIYVIEKV